jgi:hypothetical protein
MQKKEGREENAPLNCDGLVLLVFLLVALLNSLLLQRHRVERLARQHRPIPDLRQHLQHPDFLDLVQRLLLLHEDHSGETERVDRDLATALRRVLLCRTGDELDVVLREKNVVREVGESERGGAVFLVEEATEVLDEEVEAGEEALAEVGGDVASVAGRGRVDEGGEAGVRERELEGGFWREGDVRGRGSRRDGRERARTRVARLVRFDEPVERSNSV